MGSMCAKPQPDTETEYHRRQNRSDSNSLSAKRMDNERDDEEVQPLVNQDAIKINMDANPEKRIEVNRKLHS